MNPNDSLLPQFGEIPPSCPQVGNLQKAVTFIEEVRQVFPKVSRAAVQVPSEPTAAHCVLAGGLMLFGVAAFIAVDVGTVPAFYEAVVAGVVAVAGALLAYRRQLTLEESVILVRFVLQSKTYRYDDLEFVGWRIYARHGTAGIIGLSFRFRGGRYFDADLSSRTAKAVAYAASRVIAEGGDTKSWLLTPPASTADVD